MNPSYSSTELASFASFLGFDFINGSDILNYTLTNINILYIIVAEAPDVSSARKLLAADALVQAVHFYERYGKAVGMRTLYDFVETYYRCNISTIGLAKVVFPNWSSLSVPHIHEPPDFPGIKVYVPATHQSLAVMHNPHLCHDPNSGAEELNWELNTVMNKPLFEVSSLRKWAMESIIREGIQFKAFQNLVLGSYWFQDRQAIMQYLASACGDDDKNTAMQFLCTYTTKDIASEMMKGKISTTRFADAFPEILVTALIACDTSITGKQLARHLFMCAIDLAGDAKEINKESLTGMSKRHKSYNRRGVLDKKVAYLCESWSPSIKLITKDCVEWKGRYTVKMLDEYIDIMRNTPCYVMRQSFDTYASRYGG